MTQRAFSWPVLTILMMFLAVNCAAGLGFGLLVTRTTIAAVAVGLALPSVSLLFLAALWMQFRRQQQA
ncbi:hypothetical protein [uncultured Sphingomonas sp.]|uniref:hypothetical protein n=1 Tax=uncultured Sphingomonas sp. TaxID=158754 RepID=UPI0025D9EAC7|nr:hypothetical protein [uncultured Sphingomonas sp.]